MFNKPLILLFVVAAILLAIDCEWDNGTRSQIYNETVATPVEENTTAILPNQTIVPKPTIPYGTCTVRCECDYREHSHHYDRFPDFFWCRPRRCNREKTVQREGW